LQRGHSRFCRRSQLQNSWSQRRQVVNAAYGPSFGALRWGPFRGPFRLMAVFHQAQSLSRVCVPGRPRVSTNTDADGKIRSPRECTFPPHGLGRGRTGRDDPPSISKWRRWSPASHTPRWAGKTHETEEAPAEDGKDSAIACSVVLPLTYQGIVREAARGTIGCSVYFSLSIRYSCPGRGRREDHLESASPAEPIGGNGSDGRALARPRAALPPHARQYDSCTLGTLSEVSRYFRGQSERE
jgi:hypothetical protein